MISDKFLLKIKDKILNEERITTDEAIKLYQPDISTIELGMLADIVRRRKHGDKAYYVYNQHLNYTNICTNKCLFCAYAKDKTEPEAFSYSIGDVRDKLLDRLDEPILEIHIVGGINPDLDLNYYIDMLTTVKEIRPNATIKAFTAVEIEQIAKSGNLSIKETIEELKKAGLKMMPGGGAEILNKRIRKKLFPRKTSGEDWLKIHKIAHEAGILTNATMLYGHIETVEERVGHLEKLRELQDEARGFSAFIPLAFHSENTSLPYIYQTGAFDDLKTIAIARLFLDNFDHIKAYWVMIGKKLAQVSLAFGADDLDGTIMDEKIAHMAGAKTATAMTIDEIEHLIASAGFTPVMRNSFYEEVK